MTDNGYPTSRNIKPRPLEVGKDAYHVLEKRHVKILDKHRSAEFGSGTGYLVVTDGKPSWVDATWFWTDEQIQSLVEESKL